MAQDAAEGGTVDHGCAVHAMVFQQTMAQGKRNRSETNRS
jgi:hypothetical protein